MMKTKQVTRLPLHLFAFPTTMEIEIKIRLPTEEDTARLEQVLGGKPFTSEDQDNVFFEGAHKELYV
jgi:hypothetical protein